MWLKRSTILFLVIGFLMLITWPWTLGVKVPDTRQGRLAYSQRMVVYVTVLTFVMVGAGVCAILVVRQAREEYRKIASENMKRLLEETLKDAKKQDG